MKAGLDSPLIKDSYPVPRSTRGTTAGAVRLTGKILLISLVALVACEVFWRCLGVKPMPSDLIGFARLRKEADRDNRAVALIGSSRILCDLDPKVLNRELPGAHFYQLAINGNSALPVLEDLAKDTKFHGSVICEFNPGHMLERYPFRQKSPYLDFYHASFSGAFIETWLHEHLKQELAFFSTDIWTYFSRRMAGKLDRYLERPEADRFMPLHNRGKDNADLVKFWLSLIQNGRQSFGQAADLSDTALAQVPNWVERIQSRGGQVMFVRMPVSGSVLQAEGRVVPNRKDLELQFAKWGLELIDFSTTAELAQFDCPDQSHLDADQAQQFSLLLARIVETRRLLSR